MEAEDHKGMGSYPVNSTRSRMCFGGFGGSHSVAVNKSKIHREHLPFSRTRFGHVANLRFMGEKPFHNFEPNLKPSLIKDGQDNGP